MFFIENYDSSIYARALESSSGHKVTLLLV